MILVFIFIIYWMSPGKREIWPVVGLAVFLKNKKLTNLFIFKVTLMEICLLIFFLKVQIPCSVFERSFVRDCFRSFAFSYTDLLEISQYIHENFCKFFYKNMF